MLVSFHTLSSHSLFTCTNLSSLSIRNINAVARTQNSMIGFADRELGPLINAHTGENIEGFPNTAAIIGCVTNTFIDRVLLALST